MTTQKDIFSTNEGKWDFAIAIAVIALVGFFIYMMAFKNTVDEMPDTEVIEVTSNNDDDEEVEAIESQDVMESSWKSEAPLRVSKVKRTDALDGNDQAKAIIITDYEVTESISVEENSEKIPAASESIEVIEETPPLEIEEVAQTEGKNTTSETRAIKEETKLETIEEEEEEEEAIPASEQVDHVEVNNSADATGCAVIVGSFKNANNIKRIIEKLEEMELDIVQGQTRPGLNYVGVPIECSETNAQEDLVQLLNRTFKIESWVKRK